MILWCDYLYSNDKVETLEPPPESVPGERVFVEGYDQEGVRFSYLMCGCRYWLCPLLILEPDEQLNPKKKIFETIQVLREL